FLDERRSDDSARRENLPALAALAGSLLAGEAMKAVLGLAVPSAGRLIVFDFLTFESTQHVVLRKPWCPVCG
ncbi:MAG: TOMM precursor leader peptide-binding protein, partial [Bryobacteraceae bacterium]